MLPSGLLQLNLAFNPGISGNAELRYLPSSLISMDLTGTGVRCVTDLAYDTSVISVDSPASTTLCPTRTHTTSLPVTPAPPTTTTAAPTTAAPTTAAPTRALPTT